MIRSLVAIFFIFAVLFKLAKQFCMILYNVTVKIASSVKEDWLKWMKEVHIPDVMKTGLFVSNQMSRILGEDETEGTTFAIQYNCHSMEDFQTYQDKFAKALQAEHTERYNNQYVAFRTLLEVVE